MASFDSIKTYAQLNGIWTDISADVLTRSLSGRWGIYGTSHTSVLADIGELRFTLKNTTDKYNPDGASPLSGWGAGVKIKEVFTYSGFPYVRFLGYIPKDGLRFSIGKSSAEAVAEVTALDWMKFATDTPIISPSIEENKTADEAITSILARVPFPASGNLDTGTYTFPTVFDGTTQKTTAYSEFSRLAYSESPGRIYLVKQRDSGQLLRFENSTARATPTQKTTVSLSINYIKNHSGGNWINHADDKFKNHSPTTSGSAVVTLDSAFDDIDPSYGTNIVNYATATAYPKRTDEDLQILYRLPYPVPLLNGETKTIKGRYVDPSGGGTQINAIVESMQTPDVPGDPDPTLMVLLNYTAATFVDETGRHTVTQNDVTRFNDVYNNGFNDVMGSGVLGPYAVYGGYSNYQLTMPTSTDFDLFDGSTPCTIGFYAAMFNITSGQSILSRNAASTKPTYLLGYANGSGNNLGIYMSSDGATWDVASNKSWGMIALNKWIYYELNYDAGWFYAFADGKLTDKWYNATALPATSATMTIGKTQSTVYAWFAHDMFFIRKGICLHKTDFDIPRRQVSPTLDGDYLLNTLANGGGTDLSSGLVISATYTPDEVTYTLTNNSGSDGFITHLQARGRGLYNYDRITATAENATSINANGYQSVNVQQYYQQDLDAGTVWINSIVTNEATSRTVLQSISFYANRSEANMLRFLQCDVGDLIRVTIASQNIDGYYHIQNVGFSVTGDNVVRCTWGLVEGNTP
jgi:hypothetical protein